MTHVFDKSRLPSRHVSVGPERAPQRSYYYAMGMTEEEIARPFVGGRLGRQRQRAVQHHARFPGRHLPRGRGRGGGTPRRFNTITVTDGIAMGHQGMIARWSAAR